MQNMTESPKKSVMSKYSNKFSCRIEKHNNTSTVYKESIFKKINYFQ